MRCAGETRVEPHETTASKTCKLDRLSVFRERRCRKEVRLDSSDRLAEPRAGSIRRVGMAVVLTVGVLVALTAFSGVGFAGSTHGTPSHDQYHGPHHH